jgi:hypothetical protein
MSGCIVWVIKRNLFFGLQCEGKEERDREILIQSQICKQTTSKHWYLFSDSEFRFQLQEPLIFDLC